jgi:RNA polymerase sigma-70 factor (ECF subfamily)
VASLSFFREVDLGGDFGPFAMYRKRLGYVPGTARAQTLMPRLAEAQAKLEQAILFEERSLRRKLKEQIFLVTAASRSDSYGVSGHYERLRGFGASKDEVDVLLADYRNAGLRPEETLLVEFCLKLSHWGPWIQANDLTKLRESGFDDDSIQEAVLVTGMVSYLSALAAGLGVEPEFGPRELPKAQIAPPPPMLTPQSQARRDQVSYLHSVYRSPKTFAPFELIQRTHGYVPNFFRAQTSRADLIEAEAEAIVGILYPEDVLDRKRKEYILLVVSAANLNSYCVAVHANLLRGLGIPAEEGDQIAVDYREANLPEKDRALLEFCLRINRCPAEGCLEDVQRLRGLGYSEEQVLEAIATTALNNFANTVQMGLGIEPDFEPPRVFEKNKMYLSPAAARPTEQRSAASIAAVAAEDPDAALVGQAQRGSLDAFETLVRNHNRRVYRTLMAILGEAEDAKDALQDVFLSAFKHLAGFQGRSRFSTWLVSIARNTAVQRLRERKSFESLDESGGPEEEFRPRQLRAWQDDPEQQYSASEMRQLVEKSVMQLPVKYRVVLMLRDLEQLSTEQVAEDLGLSVPAVKARLLRGRLMLRESLTPHFAATGRAAI